MANDIKYQINAQLAENYLTPDNTEDMIAVPVPLGTADKQRILAEMKAEDSGLREETILHVFNLQNRVVKRLILTGYEVNTELYHASADLRGLISGSRWDPEKNTIVVNFSPGAELREAIKHTTVNLIGKKEAAFSVTGVVDTATRAEDASATAGRAFTLTGKNIRIEGTDPAVGLVLIDADGTETTVTKDLFVINDLSRVTFIIPAELAAGTYTLRLTTQCSGHSSRPLKNARSLEKTLYIGTKPPTGGGTQEPGGGDDGDDDQSGSPL